MDEYIASLSHVEVVVFAYLFTNERANLSGLYYLPDRYICFVLSITQAQLDAIKQKFEADRKYFFYKGWVYIVNSYKHQTYNPLKNIIKAYEAEINKVPQDVREYLFDLKKVKLSYPFDTTKLKISFNKNRDIVIDIDIDIDSSLGGSLGKYTDVNNEDVDPDEIDRGIRLMEQLKDKSATN